jgi:P-type Cu+ transporter
MTAPVTAGTRTGMLAEPDTTQVELVISGMTCAACAARIQARLNKLDGITAAARTGTGGGMLLEDAIRQYRADR